MLPITSFSYLMKAMSRPSVGSSVRPNIIIPKRESQRTIKILVLHMVLLKLWSYKQKGGIHSSQLWMRYVELQKRQSLRTQGRKSCGQGSPFRAHHPYSSRWSRTQFGSPMGGGFYFGFQWQGPNLMGSPLLTLPWYSMTERGHSLPGLANLLLPPRKPTAGWMKYSEPASIGLPSMSRTR